MGRPGSVAVVGLVAVMLYMSFDTSSRFAFIVQAASRKTIPTALIVGLGLTPRAAMATDGAVAAGPKGKYCGQAGGLRMKLDFTDSSKVDFSINPYTGSQSSCLQEAYSYDDATGKIQLNNKSDCLKLAWRKQGNEPEEVRYQYMKGFNYVKLTVSLVSSELHPENC
mmetsp:Transcript_16703/g.32691  ORF Transcript_16703/g.32691 Transcript_16703/m.32691 type:complete len:167 (+) Transcript_16703:49-549(+)